MPFDPDSPTFYGEAYPVEIGRDITGSAIVTKASGLVDGQAVTYLFDDDYTQTADAGDSILFGVYPERFYLEADSDVAFSVVVELAAGSTGTFRLSVGVDPAFELTSETLCTETLGTFTAAPGRVAAPVAAAWTAAMIVDGSQQPLIFVEVLTGSVVIRQIRVRAWPPDGPAGAWAADPDFETEAAPRFAQSGGVIEVNAATETPQAYQSGGPQAYVAGPGTYGGFDDFGDSEGSFADMVEALAGEPFPTYQAFDYGTHYDGFITGDYDYTWALHEGTPAHDWKGSYHLGMVLLMFQPITYSFRQAGMTYNDPDRIPWENAAAVRDATTGGTLQSDFGGWAVNPTITAGETDYGHIGMRVFSLDEPGWDQQGVAVISGRFYQFYYDSSGLSSGIGTAPGPDAGEVSLPDSAVVGIEIAPRMVDEVPGSFEDFTYESVVGVGSVSHSSRSVTYAVTRARHVIDNVQFFDPALAPAPESDPRFYVKDLAGVMRPVGFGKPSTETAVFHVPTAQGRYRDLTTAEYVTYGPESRPPGGYPLKVKRRDTVGEPWWDHVAWLVPDEG